MRGTTADLVAKIVLVGAALLAATAAQGASLPCNLQLGAIPRIDGGGGWSLAVPLGVRADDCRLETSSPALEVVTAPDGGEAWLVFRPAAEGPATGLLELGNPSSDRTRRVAVAGEVVRCTRENLPPLLVVSSRGDRAERRYLRLDGLPAPVSCTMDGMRARLGPPTAGDWIPLDLIPARGVGESRGALALGDEGVIVPVQYSAAETITVMAQAALPEGWSYGAVRPFGEQLVDGRLRGRAAVLGRREAAGALRIYESRYDADRGRRTLVRAFAREIPDFDGSGPAAVRALRVRGRQGAREHRLLTVGGESAALWHPTEGWLGARSARGLRATGVVATSRMHRNALYSLRREIGGGATWLRRWTVVDEGGRSALRGRRAEFPLEERFGVRGLRAFAMRARRDVARWPEEPASERLLILAARDGGAKAPLPVALYTLSLDPDDPAVVASARRSFTTRLRWSAGEPRPYLSYARGRKIGGAGYPARLEAGIPGITPGRFVDITGLGDRFAGSPYVEGTRHSIDAGAYGFEVPVFLGLENDANGTSVRRYSYAGETTELRAAGAVAEHHAVALRASKRLRHAWLVTAEPGGGPGARHSLRLLDIGLPPGFNLPPRVDAGADLRSNAREVELRARALDPNGDPLDIRWSAPGVEFADPRGAVTSARFPEGVTQVRVAVREAGGRYEAVDLMRVAVVAPTGTARTPGLRTRITGLHPNPANPRLQVAFTTDRAGPVRVSVHDVSGRLVRVLVDERRGAGAWDATWDGQDSSGLPVASGVYLVRLSAPGGGDTRRGVIVR